MNEKISSEIANLYWLRHPDSNVFVHKTSDIEKMFGLSGSNPIPQLMKKTGHGILKGTCRFCGHQQYAWSRSKASEKYTECHTGFCDSCMTVPLLWETFCDDCKKIKRKQWTESENSRLMEKMNTACVEDFDVYENRMMSIFKSKYNMIFVDGELSFNKLSFFMKTSLNHTKEVLESTINKGGILCTYTDDGRTLGYVNENIEVGEYLDTNHLKIISSPLAAQTFHILQESFENVFVEVPFSAFINFDDIKHELESTEHGSFFMKRMDFVCADDRFNVLCVIEYNGKHHFREGQASKKSRLFKRRICSIVGLPFLEINSPIQLKDKLNDFLDEILT